MHKGTPQIRCAIYTRKSTEEGLDQDFNSLHAQREAGEAFIKSQKHTGWTLIPRHYDDGGFTGGNMERPALQQLLEDVDSHRVDCVVVYKVDRLSRSLLDFARLIDRFDQRSVSFVSVTQQFNTTSSLGRLTLNILLSFASSSGKSSGSARATRCRRRAAKASGSAGRLCSATMSIQRAGG
jgi:site-specific DNA recombinase